MHSIFCPPSLSLLSPFLSPLSPLSPLNPHLLIHSSLFSSWHSEEPPNLQRPHQFFTSGREKVLSSETLQPLLTPTGLQSVQVSFCPIEDILGTPVAPSLLSHTHKSLPMARTAPDQPQRIRTRNNPPGWPSGPLCHQLPNSQALWLTTVRTRSPHSCLPPLWPPPGP